MRPAWLLLVAATAALASTVPPDPATDAEKGLVFEDGRLTARLRHVPLDQVLTALTRETGMTVTGQPRDWREVTKQFDDLPLPEAVNRLVGRQNFVLWYDGNGRPKRLELLGVPQPAPSHDPAVAPTAAGVLTAFARHGTVNVSGELAKALGGKQQATLPQLLLAMRKADNLVRAQAQQVLLDAIERDPALLATLRSAAVDQLAKLVRGLAGDQSEAFVRFLSVRSTDPALRAKAAQVAKQLRGPDASRLPG